MRPDVVDPGGGLRSDQTIIINGLQGTGKTTLAEKLTRKAWCALFVDITGHDYDQPGRLAVTPYDLREYPRLLDDPHTRLQVIPRGETDKEVGEEIIMLLVLLGLFERPAPRRNMVVVFDEVGDYRAQCEAYLNRLFRRGGHLGICPILASQVATDIPRTCRRIASDTYYLGQQDSQDIDAIDEATHHTGVGARVKAWRKYEPPIHFSRAKLLLAPTRSAHG